jgi:hypothetical protein
VPLIFIKSYSGRRARDALVNSQQIIRRVLFPLPSPPARHRPSRHRLSREGNRDVPCGLADFVLACSSRSYVSICIKNNEKKNTRPPRKPPLAGRLLLLLLLLFAFFFCYSFVFVHFERFFFLEFELQKQGSAADGAAVSSPTGRPETCARALG